MIKLIHERAQVVMVAEAPSNPLLGGIVDQLALINHGYCGRACHNITVFIYF